MRLLFKRLPHALRFPIPAYQTSGSAAFDLTAAIEEDEPTFIIHPHEWRLVPTGICVEIPPGFELQIRPRSGVPYKQGLIVMNSPGTIDSDYRGEILVNLGNFGRLPRSIQAGDRIAQAVISPIIQAELVEVTDLSETERGSGGFGSTGR